MKSVTTFLLFVGDQAGKAEEAINFYTSLFTNSHISNIDHYGAGEDEPEGSVKIARFNLNGAELMAKDSAHDHKFGFTPAVSLYVECDSREEIKNVFHSLADGGSELMPLDDYGFSQQFGWLNDRYGVSWQLNLASQKTNEEAANSQSGTSTGYVFRSFVALKYGAEFSVS